QADVADSAQVKAMFATIERELGALDILVNNAGIAFGPGDDRAEIGRKAEAVIMELVSGQGVRPHLDITQNLSDESWRRMLAVHLDGTFFCTREALRLMSRKNRGAIVNLSSVAALTGLESVPHYSAAKGGILAFTRAVARDVASRGMSVRGTPIHLMQDGTGPALLFLHSAGGAGRWLPFQERLAGDFSVYFPSHPGHGGSPAAEWIEHISDLAFHYLDLLDELGLARVHLVGASFGGWIAAEIATMASHRLASLVLIDPVGIRVDGWIYPFLFGMDIPEIVGTVFHNPMAALALAPPDQSIDTLALQYRQGAALARVAWNPYLYDPLLRRRLARIASPTLLCWGAHDRLAPLAPCGEAWAKAIPGARLQVFDDAGHVPHLEEADAVAHAVAEFCRLQGAKR